MALEHRITGAPGAGKTERLRRGVERYVESGEYDPEDIVLTSFTRAAAAVLRGRIDVPQENVATLHSLARRTLGGSVEIAEVGKWAKEWNDSGVPPQWKIGQATASDEDGLAMPDEKTDVLGQYSLARSKMLPEAHPTWERLAAFRLRWEDFKRQNDLHDFTDMIELAWLSGGPCYGEPPVIIVDEAQDLVPLQWTLVRHWASHPSVEKFIVGGDPAQTIHSFAGARPEEMLAAPHAGQTQEMLPASHRLPRSIAAAAERYLSRHSGTMMDGRAYTPRDEEGVVRRDAASWRYPEAVVTAAAEAAQEGRSSLILAQCAYMLEPAVRTLRERGLAFHNPYRRSNGRWNPLGMKREGAYRTVDRVAAYVEARDPALWLPLLRAEIYHTRGGKKIVEAEPVTWREWVRPDLVAALEAGDLRTLQQYAMAPAVRPLEYAVAIMRRHGPDALDQEPLIGIGTGHSTKGGEASSVYVFPDVSMAGAEEMYGSQAGRDAATRLGYVMMTRARDELVICSPAGKDDLGL